jgi:hypothetical protein
MIIKTVNPNEFKRRVSCANNAIYAMTKFRNRGHVRRVSHLKISEIRDVLKLNEVYQEIENFDAWVESSHLNEWHAFKEGMKF